MTKQSESDSLQEVNEALDKHLASLGFDLNSLENANPDLVEIHILKQIGQTERNEAIKDKIASLLTITQAIKPGDRSELDRRYAVGITEIERLLSWWQFWVVEDN